MALNRYLPNRSKRAQRSLISSASAARPMAFERLEDRQMMSVTLDLRGTNGSKQAVVTAVGQVVTLDLYAEVTGNQAASMGNNGMISATGSFIGTKTNSATSVNGNLSNANVNPDYAANGASDGTVVDLNSDGNTDIGSNNDGDIAGFYSDRAGYLQTDSTNSGNTSTFYLGSVDYTVTSLSYGQETDVNFRLRNGIPSGAFDVVWQQDGNGENDQIGTALIGTPMVFTDPNLSAPVQTGSIAGTVSKVVSGTTSAASGVTVYLDKNNNGVLDSGDISTTSSSTGAYSFTNLPAGSYGLREVVPSGYSQTSPIGSPTLETVSAGQNITGQNFVNTAATVTGTGSIAGTVSKVVSGATSTFSGVTVYLDTNNNGSLDSGETSTTTSSTGTYSFSGLAAGTYVVREVVPSGYTAGTSSLSVTLGSGTKATGENFTDTATAVSTGGTSSISGEAFIDKNGNGTLDSGEVGIANVEIYYDANNDSIPDAGDTIVYTSSTGTYSFTGLAAGTYLLREVVPTGSKVAKASVNVGLGNNWVVTGENWANTAPSTTVTTGSIAGTVSKSVNGSTSALSGVTVFLDTNNNGVLDSGDVTTTTSSNGSYSFAGLTAGTYSVIEVVPSGYTATTSTLSVTLGSGSNVTGENFVDTSTTTTATGSISGTVSKVVSGATSADSGVTVYLDINNNGSFDSGDISAITNSTGAYTFSGLAAGTYRVRQVVASGYSQTSPASSPTTITLAAGQTVTGQNFIDTAATTTSTTITLSGTVFNDTNGNGVQDGSEAGLSGWTVYCDLNNDGKFESNESYKVSPSNGKWSFTALKAGTYTLRIVAQSGYKTTAPSSGFYTVTLTAGSNVVENFGEKKS